MAVDKRKKLRPSIFDRLIDERPDLTVESEKDRSQVLRELRESVRRDLENLFNTRYRIFSPPEGTEQLEDSLINYGLPDLATINLMDDEIKLDFCRQLERSIKKFEPRFKSVKITTLENSDHTDQTIRFRIDAVLYADPAPEIVVVDSVLEPVTRSVDVAEVNGERDFS